MELIIQRTIRLQAESLTLRGVEWVAVGVGLVGGALEVAAFDVERVFYLDAELGEEFAGFFLRVALGPVGVLARRVGVR
jgi:hypothetical protein